MQHPALALVEDARDQRQVMVDLGAPVLDHDAGARAQPRGGSRQRRTGGMSGSDQLAIEPTPGVFATAILDIYRTAFGQASAIMPADRRGSRQFGRLTQQSRHHAHGIPQ